MSFPGKNPLAYLGIKETDPPELIKAKRNPTTSDNKYDIGDIWINETTATSFQLCGLAGGLATWATLGGASADVNTLSGDSGGNRPPTGGNILIAGGTNITTVGAASTITVDLDDAVVTGSVATSDAAAGLTISSNNIDADGTDASINIGLTPKGPSGNVVIDSGGLNVTAGNIEDGTSGTRITATNGAFSSDGNAIQGYVVTTGGTAGTTYRAIRGDLQVATGNGTESPQGIRASTDVLAGGDIEEAYGSFSNAYQQDGSAIDSNLIGSLNFAMINEVNPADQPQQWIAGSQSIVSFDAAAGIPTASIVTGALSHVTYDAPMNSRAHGYVASRNGGGAGGTAGAAYKVVAGGGITDWTYGVDLVTGGAGAAALYATGDIRLANGVTIDSINATDTDITCPANGRLDIQLGDAAGVEEFSIRSSAPAVVAKINSLGELVNTNVECGNNATRKTEYTTNNSLVQAYADDNTAAGASTRTAVFGNLSVSAGNGNGTPNAVLGELTTAAGSNVLQVSGVLGKMDQVDGSVVASTATGVEGWLNLRETTAGDLPQVYGFGVKGYLDSTDGAGVPTGMIAGVGSIVEYNTPFNAKAYGYLASRLNSGGGAGTAGQAAYGVLQGTVAIADWLYGLDLYNGGVAYTTADIRFQNQSKATVAATGLTFSGDVAARSLNATNTNITSFNVNPILQSDANTGAAPSGATGDYNIMYCQDGITMEQFILGAGQTIIAPRLTNDGLLISLDLANAEGAEYYFGHTTRAKHSFTIGTSAAFFVEATFKVADAGSSDPLWLGFRKLGAPNAAYTTYTDAGVIGLHQTTNADTVIIGSNLNNAGWAYVNTTNAFTDGQTHTFRVNVSAAGVVTYLIDGLAPTVTQALTFDNGDVVIPFIHHLFINAGGVPSAINLQALKCGFQAWT